MSSQSNVTKPRESGWWETAKIVVQALALAMVVRIFLFQPFNIPSGSMKSTLLVGDYLYYVNDNGIARCVDAKTGKPKWQERLDGQFSTSPIYAAGNIYFLGENGKSFVVAAEPTYKLIERNQLDAGCMASPAVSGEELFIRTKTHLYCISEKK